MERFFATAVPHQSVHFTSPEGQGRCDEKGSEMQVDGVEQNGGGSMGIHLVKKKMVYVKARVREEEGFLILENALLCL